ncbi:MAG TPA: EamA family transporter [Polyangiaceae bacterium]|nr:EamA family transporter [Polyangiaceae bacterium]
MLKFLLLCLLSRLFYTLNDIFTGRLARQHDRLELAALRGVSLGITMAPVLFWVPRSAWASLLSEPARLGGIVFVTAIANVLQLQSARYMPFGLRASVILTGISLGSVLLGWFVLGERLSGAAAGWCALVVLSAALAALGDHATHEIEPRLWWGAALALAGASLMAVVALFMKGLTERTHTLLAAWAWEFGSGVVLLPVMLVRRTASGALPRHFARVALASSPTAIGSSASMLALGSGRLGLWGALAGTQVLFTAVLGVLWHRELMGLRRWACFVAASLGIAGLALTRG